MLPDDIEKQKSDEQKRLDKRDAEWRAWRREEEERVDKKLSDEDLDQIEDQNRKGEEYFEAKAIERQKEFKKQESETLESEPYEVIEEVYRMANSSSRCKIIKIIERKTSKIIGQKIIELGNDGKSTE